MKNNLNYTNLITLALIVVLALGIWQPRLQATPALAAAPANEPASVDSPCATGRSIQVSGSAVVNVVPDRALLTLGVQSNGYTPDATQNANFQAIQRIVAAVKALGIEAKDIATD